MIHQSPCSFLFLQIRVLYRFFSQFSIACLHPKWYMFDQIEKSKEDALSFDYPTLPLGFYFLYDINELNDDIGDDNEVFPITGLADFFYFDLLLLFILPVNCSFGSRVFIAFVCIILVQLADLCTVWVILLSDCRHWPGLPFPTIVVTAYMIAIDYFIGYSNTCEDLIQ